MTFVVPTDHAKLRQKLRQARRQLTQDEQQQHAQALAMQLCALPLMQQARAVGATFAFDGEIDPIPAALQLHSLGHSIYLPCLRADQQLNFALWQPDMPMKLNQFGILEPDSNQYVKVDVLDVLLLPLVGVDLNGNRLGMGGGYYDRTLAYCHKRPYLIGVAHACQQVEHLATQPWDVPLDALLTEASMTVWRAWQADQ